MRNINYKKVLFYIVFLSLVITGLYTLGTLVAKEYQLRSYRVKIERIEAKIETNKQERLNCETNMKLWNAENEENRQIVKELKENYNKMVGFTSA
jgi:hypothetical protein